MAQLLVGGLLIGCVVCDNSASASITAPAADSVGDNPITAQTAGSGPPPDRRRGR